jgi:hypothetical protein
MVARVRLVVVDRNVRMGLGLGPDLDLVVGHGTVVLRTLGQAVGVMAVMMVLEVADLVEVVYRRNRPSPHRFLLEVDLQA